MEMPPLLYTVAEVAQLLHVNLNTVHNYRRARLLRFMKLGNYKVRREELERFLRESEGKDLTDPFHVVDLKEETDI